MFTNRQLLLIVTLLSASNSLYPMFSSVTAWFNRAGTSVRDNKGTALLAGAGICTVGAVAYYAWKKLTRTPRRVVRPASKKPRTQRRPEVVPHEQNRIQPKRGTLKRKYIAAVLANDTETIRQAWSTNELDINAYDDNGNTLLHHAVFNFECNKCKSGEGFFEYGAKEATIKFLVGVGIDIAQQNNKEFTAYEWAKKNGRLNGKEAAVLDMLNPASV